MKFFHSKSVPFNSFLALWTRLKFKGLSMVKIKMYRRKLTLFFLNFESIKFYVAKDQIKRERSLIKI